MYSLLSPLPGVYVFDLEQIFPIPEQDLCTFYNLQLLDEHHEPSCCKDVAFLVA
jgi:hypothetical protein